MKPRLSTLRELVQKSPRLQESIQEDLDALYFQIAALKSLLSEETLLEISRTTLRSYYSKAIRNKEDHDMKAGMALARANSHMIRTADRKKEHGVADEHLRKSRKREKGMTRAFDVLSDRARKR